MSADQDVVVYPGPPRGLFRLLWRPCEKHVALYRLTVPLWWARWQIWHWLYEHMFVCGWLNPHPGVWVRDDEAATDYLLAQAEILTAYYLNMACRSSDNGGAQ
jgi:hypothetical protein